MSKSWVFFLALALSASLTIQPAARAQTAAGKIDDWPVVLKTPAGERLVVELKDGRTLKGKLGGASDAGLTLSHKGRVVELSRPSVLRIYHVVRGTRGRSALIGAAVGAGAGAAFGARYAAEELDSNARNRGGAILGTALLGAGIFGGVGALIGRGRGRGEARMLIYQAP